MNQPLPRYEAWRRFTDPALLFIVLAVLWEESVELFGIKRYLLPPLSQVLDSLWTNRMALLAQSWVTTQEVLAGFALAVLGGVLLVSWLALTIVIVREGGFSSTPSRYDALRAARAAQRQALERTTATPPPEGPERSKPARVADDPGP